MQGEIDLTEQILTLWRRASSRMWMPPLSPFLHPVLLCGVPDNDDGHVPALERPSNSSIFVKSRGAITQLTTLVGLELQQISELYSSELSLE